MIKVENKEIPTYKLTECNLKRLCKNMYPVQTSIDYCPMCGEKLKKDYCYAVQVSESECIKLQGAACSRCDAFFTDAEEVSISYIEQNKYKEQPFVLSHKFDIIPEFAQKNRLSQIPSAFLRFLVYAKGKMAWYTLVYDRKNEDESRNIFHFASKTGVTLIKAEMALSRCVELDHKECTVLCSTSEPVLFDRIREEVYAIAQTKKIFAGELPELTSQRTLFVYKGNIKCHKKHNIDSYRAQIKSIHGQMQFYVEYCCECDKFLMKYADYDAYLKKYKFFPMKINLPKAFRDDYNRAETSPLYNHGYSVSQNSGLSEAERHAILAYILDYGILSKRKVLDYLESFISSNRSKPANGLAVTKWEEDKEFVLNYRLAEKPLVVIGELKRRKG